MRVAILDDYLGLALKLADWSTVQRRCKVQVFSRNLVVPDEAAKVLEPFEILCTMRERMALPAALIRRLPNLKFVAITGAKHRTLDLAAASARQIPVSYSLAYPDDHYGTPELTWGLLLAAVRQIAAEDRRMRQGAWQTSLGVQLHGKTLGIVGLGGIGKTIARYGLAFGMRVIAWSQNLTADAAVAAGVVRVEKEELFRTSDVVSIHVVLSDRTRGLVTGREIGFMKPTAYLINTARGPIVEQSALLEALQLRRIAGAALDVFDQEPLPPDHVLRSLDNVVLTPHLGYVTEEVFRGFYRDTVEAVTAFLDGAPIRLLNAEVLPVMAKDQDCAMAPKSGF
jgi:phosphoglycerate dehydrogenase-like enzyme